MSINTFFEKKKVLVTGVTGFVGKVLLEKLLRCVPSIEFIYILIRTNKASDQYERFKREILGSQCFDRLKKLKGADFIPFIESKVKPINGNMLSKNLGLSQSDLSEITTQCQFIINCAASIDFNAKLEDAININVIGTKNMLDVASQFRNLENFVHVSTAYVNSDKSGFIHEQLYDSQQKGTFQKVLELRNTQKATSEVIGGFPNTYTFTKNLAEHVLFEEKPASMPLIIFRPSIIGASLVDPFPGWIDKLVATATIYFFSGMGIIKQFHTDENLIGDEVPVDMVASALIVLLTSQPSVGKYEVIHFGTSYSNPVSWKVSKEAVLDYWRSHPSQFKISEPNVSCYKHRRVYELMQYKQKLPVMMYTMLAKLLGSTQMKRSAYRMQNVLERAEEIKTIFAHFNRTEYIFECAKVQKLIETLSPQDKDIFHIDVTIIDWKKYKYLFQYGIHKYILKDNVPPIDFENKPSLFDMSKKTYFSDILWAMNQGHTFHPKSKPETISLIINTPRVQQAIKLLIEQKIKKSKQPNYERIHKEVELDAIAICKNMFANYNMPLIRLFGWFLTKVFKQIYEKVVIEGIQQITSHNSKVDGPLILVPSHRSYIDFLMCSYVLFAYNVKCPHIAASEEFLQMSIIPSILRSAGAFFLKSQQHNEQMLYRAVFYEYIQRLLMEDCYIEFFIEGTRSRSGKTLSQPKFDILNIITDSVFDNKLTNATIVPLTINYEKVLEVDTYPYELLGEEKVKESLLRVLQASKILATNYGKVQIEFGQIIKVKQFSEQVVNVSQMAVFIPPKDLQLKNPFESEVDRGLICKRLGFEILYRLNERSVIMPTNIVAAILLMHRKGISEERLFSQVEWLNDQLTLRGGIVATASFELGVRNSLTFLQSIVVKTKKNIFELNIQPNLEHKNVLLLSYYRNSMTNLIMNEAIVCSSLNSFGHQISFKEGIDKTRLFEKVRFLARLLEKEYVVRNDIRDSHQFEAILTKMVEYKVLQIQDSKVKVNEKFGEGMVSFLCSFIWPLVESYWATIVYIYSVTKSNYTLHFKNLIQQIQWFAESMYQERVMEHYESCSQETIKNALLAYKDMNIVKFEQSSKQATIEIVANQDNILELEAQVSRFQKNQFALSIRNPFYIAQKSSIVDLTLIPKL